MLRMVFSLGMLEANCWQNCIFSWLSKEIKLNCPLDILITALILPLEGRGRAGLVKIRCSQLSPTTRRPVHGLANTTYDTRGRPPATWF